MPALPYGVRSVLSECLGIALLLSAVPFFSGLWFCSSACRHHFFSRVRKREKYSRNNASLEKTKAEKTSAFVGFFLDRRVKRTKWSATDLAAIFPVACTHPSSHAESLQFGLPAAGGGVVERIEV